MPDNGSLIGQVVGGYDVLREIGRGGMGVVYLARDRSLQRPVALKVLHEEFSRDSAWVRRFKQEARAAARTSHPNIVTVYRIGMLGASCCIAMEYVKGMSLDRLLQQGGALSMLRALEIARQAAAALAETHRNGLIHCDIKPRNILLDKADRVKVTDFGVARPTVPANSGGSPSAPVLGSPAYMAPEQFQGGRVDARADIYALGVTLYEMLSGQPPFSGESPLAVVFQAASETAPRLRDVRPDIPEGVDRLVARMMAKRPEDRYPSAEALLSDLDKCIRDPLALDAERSSGTKTWRHSPTTSLRAAAWVLATRRRQAAGAVVLALAVCIVLLTRPEIDPMVSSERVPRFPTDVVAANFKLVDWASPPPTWWPFGQPSLAAAQGSVTVPPGKVVELEVLDSGMRPKAWLGGLAANTVGAITFVGTLRLDSDDVTSLLSQQTLRQLRIRNPGGVADSDIERLAALPHIDHVTLIRSEVITDAAFAHLASFPSLKTLTLDANRNITDAGIEYLGQIPGLEVLSLDASPLITDAGLAYLGQLPALELLSLDVNPQITDAGVAHLASARGLKSLYLSYTQTTDRGVQSLTPLKALETLWLENANVTDAAVPYLLQFTKLKTLGLIKTKIGPAGFEQLRRGLPSCRIDGP